MTHTYYLERLFALKKHFAIAIASIFSMHLCANAQQAANLDPAKGYINVDIPKTPESAAFAKYGNPEVNEFTGTANISIPIYTLKSQYLEVPITLNYQATGIKVNQEASWVGLGFDLIAGGRITVETRGSVDFGSSAGLGTSNTPACMTQIFNRFDNHGENAIFTPATFWEPPTPGPDSNMYNGNGISEMAQFGTGEPDIFRASFKGHSIAFFIDKISSTIKYIGEQADFIINYTLDSFNNISSWTVIDDEGITYYFNQTEKTTCTLPGSAIVPPVTTSAWLLTKILHPSGDYINFTYASYGYSVPAFTMSGSEDANYNGITTIASDQNQNIAMQSPYFITKIETQSASVNFVLATRTDLYGPGSRKLNQITIMDKITNTVKKTVTFSYSYFQATPDAGIHNYLNNLSYYLPSPLTTSAYLATSNSRLRLDSFNLNDNTLERAYRFYYNTSVPDKYSYSQDHWGYYNSVQNQGNGYGFSHLIPFAGLRGIQDNLPPATGTFSTSTVGYSRDCDPSAVTSMILDSIVYPTGGSSSFTYEPHSSIMTPIIGVIGGGVRVQTIKNYSMGKLAGITNYSYNAGRYMGTIHYFTSAIESAYCKGPGSTAGHLKYSSDGVVNFDNVLIGYGQVTISQLNAAGQSNGFILKTFNIDIPSSNYANGGGFDIQPPYFIPSYTLETGQVIPAESTTDGTGFWTYDKWLDPINKNFPPTPSANLEGKLTQEAYFDAYNNEIKSVNYYYHLANYSNNFYDVRAILKRSPGFAGSCGLGIENGYGSGGERPVDLFISPAKSFHTLTDSIVELTYSGSNVLKNKKVYQYNSYYQPMYESIYNSDGTQTITFTQTSESLTPNYPLTPLGDAALLQNMKAAHIYDLPIEQSVIHRGTAGDSTVISSKINIYNGPRPLKVYVMETAQPLTLRTQFVPAFYNYTNYPGSPGGSSDSLKMDSHYKLYSTADYSTNSLIKTIHTLQGNTAYIWDETYNNILAQCTNTDSANIAFTSFETGATGKWAYSSAAVAADATSPTGSKAFTLASGVSVTTSALQSTTTYIVSYWSKTGTSYTVTGSTSVKQGKTINGWTYFEHTVSATTTVTISGTGKIDEVRLYPSTSQMVSYTYSPLIGISSQCDADNRITYYFYDSIGRLKWIKDQDGNIIKTIQYHFQGISGVQY